MSVPPRVLLTGASGLIGSALAPALRDAGYEVVRVLRAARAEGASGESVVWDFASEAADRAALSQLEGLEAVVHLAGKSIAGRRWNAEFKQQIRDSRVNGTQNLVDALARLNRKPRVFISASAVGYYGSDRGEEVLPEESSTGSGFLAEIAREWEGAALRAEQAGIRTVLLRLAMVVSARGGALEKMLLPFKLGLGGRIGRGRQYWSWVSLDDVVGVILLALQNDSVRGPWNVSAPQTPTNAEFTRALARALRRPSVLPVPAFILKVLLGEMAESLMLGSLRVEPRRLLELGYRFRHPELELALREMVGNSR